MTVWEHVGNVQNWDMPPPRPSPRGISEKKPILLGTTEINKDGFIVSLFVPWDGDKFVRIPSFGFDFERAECAALRQSAPSEASLSLRDQHRTRYFLALGYPRRLYQAAMRLCHLASARFRSSARSKSDIPGSGLSSSSLSVGCLDNSNVDRAPDGSQGSSGSLPGKSKAGET